MANSIIGALYLGLFTGSVGPTLPAYGLSADALPTPQCVVCGPANRRPASRIYDWSNGRVVVRRANVADGLPGLQAGESMPEQRLGMAEQQLQRMALYAGA